MKNLTVLALVFLGFQATAHTQDFASTYENDSGNCSTYSAKRYDFNGTNRAQVLQQCVQAGGSILGECSDNMRSAGGGYVSTYFTDRTYYHGDNLAEVVANCANSGGNVFDCTDNAHCD